MIRGLVQAADWDEYHWARLEHMEQRVRNGELAEMVAPDYARTQAELESLTLWLETIEAEVREEEEEVREEEEKEREREEQENNG